MRGAEQGGRWHPDYWKLRQRRLHEKKGAMGYGAGAFAFSLATLLDGGLGTDAVDAVVESVAAGLLWPITFFELVTGQTGA